MNVKTGLVNSMFITPQKEAILSESNIIPSWQSLCNNSTFFACNILRGFFHCFHVACWLGGKFLAQMEFLKICKQQMWMCARQMEIPSISVLASDSLEVLTTGQVSFWLDENSLEFTYNPFPLLIGPEGWWRWNRTDWWWRERRTQRRGETGKTSVLTGLWFPE